jgi:hypothetical protein
MPLAEGIHVDLKVENVTKKTIDRVPGHLVQIEGVLVSPRARPINISVTVFVPLDKPKGNIYMYRPSEDRVSSLFDAVDMAFRHISNDTVTYVYNHIKATANDAIRDFYELVGDDTSDVLDL